jgi:hypothetical protein
LVDKSALHKIRAGKTHRFIEILFVTVGDRVFCRWYTYGEPSWHGAFLKAPEGQVDLDGCVVDILASVPSNLDDINQAVNQAYERKLRSIGASFMLDGAISTRAMASTIEVVAA